MRERREAVCPLKYSIITFLAVILLAGCAGPIGVTRVSPRDSYNIDTENVMGDGRMSESTKAILQRYNLLSLWGEEPIETIKILANIGRTDDRRDILFALAEITYLQGGKMREDLSEGIRRQAPDMFLQSAVFAYFFLLGEGREPPPTAYDSRFRETCDLYNRGLWQAFPTVDDGRLTLTGGIRHLLQGDLPLTIKTDTLSWDYGDFEGLYPSDSFAIHGFIIRSRTPGMGMPLVGLTRKGPQSPNGGALPITAFLRLSGSFGDYLEGRSQAVLEIYSALDDSQVRVGDRPVPLETDITTPLAFRLNDAKLWRLGEKRFLTGAEVPIRVLLIQPYEPGRIPVVFVHGTASSPVWWAEMLNSLRADPEIRKNFQFWFYQYNSSNMITLSAAELREKLVEMVNQLDPQHKDPALQNMVMIGHSQGGLLTKMMVVDPGDTLWKAISDKPIDQMDMDDKVKAFVRRLLIFKPLPFVKRVIFIATPHRGSFLSKEWVRAFIRKVVRLPYNIVVNSQEFLSTLGTKLKLPDSLRGRIPTSIDGMSEENPLLMALASLPIVHDVAAHSIIAIKPGMDIATGDDGVVSYASAHLEGVESEFIVRSAHSCQSHPFTIEEVRRILLEHVGIVEAWQAPSGKTVAK